MPSLIFHRIDAEAGFVGFESETKWQSDSHFTIDTGATVTLITTAIRTGVFDQVGQWLIHISMVPRFYFLSRPLFLARITVMAVGATVPIDNGIPALLTGIDLRTKGDGFLINQFLVLLGVRFDSADGVFHIPMVPQFYFLSSHHQLGLSTITGEGENGSLIIVQIHHQSAFEYLNHQSGSFSRNIHSVTDPVREVLFHGSDNITSWLKCQI
jgi:hypothetical protein